MRNNIIILFVIASVLFTACDGVRTTGRPIDGLNDDSENSFEIPTDGLILGKIAPGGLATGVTECHQLDTDIFESTVCASSENRPPNSVLVQNVDKDGSVSSLCGSGTENCYLLKNIYSTYSCSPEVIDEDDTTPPTTGGKCGTMAYWDSIEAAQIDLCKCYSTEGSKDWGIQCDGTGDWSTCSANDAGSYWACGGSFEYELCFNSKFIMKHYDNVFSEDDGWCSDQTRKTCLADPDCWDADATQAEKEARCGGQNCFDNPYTTCVVKDETASSSCTERLDYEGTTWSNGFVAEVKSLNLGEGLYGCELANEQYGQTECCIHNPSDLDSLIPKPEWKLAYELDEFSNRPTATSKNDGSGEWVSYAETNGVQVEVVWSSDPSLFVDFPCGETPCVQELQEGVSEDVYKRCFYCGEFCGLSECCNGLDDDGDGMVDLQDSKCDVWGRPEEGGVCFG